MLLGKVIYSCNIILILLSINFPLVIDAKVQFCDVETGQTNIILDIEESRGQNIDQETAPADLPIFGELGKDIQLKLIYQKIEPVFKLEKKKLILLKPLDRDKDNLSHIIFQISCTAITINKNRSIPIIVRVSDINDNEPVFQNSPYEVTVPENTPIGATIFRNVLAEDKDAGVNGLVEYFLVNNLQNTLQSNDTPTNITDGFGTFAINFPHRGELTVAKTLDYERVQRYALTIVASDRARNGIDRLSATTTLLINIADSDDLDPSFIYRGCVSLDNACINPLYSATVPQGTLQGVLNIHPERIQAVDLDQISSSIKYSFIKGNPSTYNNYFEIDEITGVVVQKQIVDSSVNARQFEIVVQAEEVSEKKRSTTAKLTINVKPIDSFPPEIHVNAIEGFIDEHSPLGTKVLDKNGSVIRFTTTDADITDIAPLPEYSYELTTPFFKINVDGVLIVNEENLDRDPPYFSKLRFQVVARELKGNAASSPVSITVILNDINDNSPKLAIIDPVQITAGQEKRLITKANATDIDNDENAIVKYSIHHVSNNGMKKFSIDQESGEIFSVGKLMVGEHYSITVQASDIGNLYSRAIVEVTVIPGPNTKAPKFLENVYDVAIDENVDLNSTVIRIEAEDPESDSIEYSIISGNDLRQFTVGTNSGIVSVIRKLDREQITRYQLIMKAFDGGLSSTATVNIKVNDVNDNNPTFDDTETPYVFSVEEGNANLSVGFVHAYDIDEGINAKIAYTINDKVPFQINRESGEISTKEAVDFEGQRIYKFMVIAEDGSSDMRQATTSVTVNVRDIDDEVPKFNQTFIKVEIPENVPDMIVAAVRATDADSIENINYVIKDGPLDFFNINPKTGLIKTTQGLDYEDQKQISLVIGTLENLGNGKGDVVEVQIIVEDKNEFAPVFVSVPSSLTINDDTTIGTKISQVKAIDSDGSSPSNSVKYEIKGKEKALKYFQIDANSGEISLKGNLKNENDTSYQVDVYAYDLGEPQLSSLVSLFFIVNKPDSGNINAKHIKNIPLNTHLDTNDNTVGLAFERIFYSLKVKESIPTNSSLQSIRIINSKKTTADDFHCKIVNGNSENIFKTFAYENSCHIVTTSSLNFEEKSSFMVEMKLFSNQYFVNPSKNFCQLNISIEDENDNFPIFDVPQHKFGAKHTYYGVVEINAALGKHIMRVKATDADSGAFGKIKYRILEQEVTDNLQPDSVKFDLNENTGIIRMVRPVRENLKNPFRLTVVAIDNNGVEDENVTLHSKAKVIINIIDDDNRMLLIFSGKSPEYIKNHSNDIQKAIAEKTNLIIFIEKITSQNELLSKPTDSANLWFYAIDPHTEAILNTKESNITKILFDKKIQIEIIQAVANVTQAFVQGIFTQIKTKNHSNSNSINKIKATVFLEDDMLPLLLIVISTVILIIGMMGIVYICISWSRYENVKKQGRQYSSNNNPSPTNYDPVIVNAQESDISSNHSKQYETQVLGMSVVNEEMQEDIQNGYRRKTSEFRLDKRNYTQRQSATNVCSSNNIISKRNNGINYFNNNINNNKQNFMNKTIEMKRSYANPLSTDINCKPGSTLTLGRLKSERNQIINGYDDTLNRNNLAMGRNNTFSSTLGRNNSSYYSLTRHHEFRSPISNSTIDQNYFFQTTLPLAESMNQRHQNFSNESNENIYFRDDFTFLDHPFNFDRSEQETTTEL